MDSKTSSGILARVKVAREKRADPSTDAFANAVGGMENAQLKSDAFKDVGNLGLTALGIGAGSRGLVGLIQLMRSNKPKKTRSGPAYLPLPYPAQSNAKLANFLGGDDASSKAGLPWYGPAMLFGGLAGLGVGWKGMDKVLDARRQREMDSQLDGARQEFHDALLNQYDEPVKVHPNAISGGAKKAASDSTMAHVGAALDTLFEKFASVLQEAEMIADTPAGTKQALDLPNAAGAAVGGYGMYAGLSALLAGSLMYDKINKRSRSAIINKALQRRQRRQFMQRPTEIYAVPEAIPAKKPDVPALDMADSE